MKRFSLFIVALLIVGSVVAQSADSVNFVTARRFNLKLKGAEGYTVQTQLFGVPQTISVIRFSLKEFKLFPVQPEVVTRPSEMGEVFHADFAINACFWAMSTGVPTTMVKSGGKYLSKSFPNVLDRVNGVLLMYDDRVEVVQSTDAPYYKQLTEGCDNAIAVGPVLIDDGKVVDYSYIVNSPADNPHRQRKFFLTRHPRSVIGRAANGDVVMLTIDGRSADYAVGATIAETTAICRWLGMVDVINLDGGGSAALWTRKWGVVSHPCDNRKYDHEGERAVSSTLLVKRRK